MRLPDKAVMVTVCSDFQWLNTENKVNHGKCVYVILLEYFILRWFKYALRKRFQMAKFKNPTNFQLSNREESYMLDTSKYYLVNDFALLFLITERNVDTT